MEFWTEKVLLYTNHTVVQTLMHIHDQFCNSSICRHTM